MATVLIVDDANIMRMNMKKMMEKLGHEVVDEAVDGYDAIQKYEKLNPDFVTMDITMPEVNGIEDGIEAVKQIVIKDPRAKVVMVTSHGEQNKVMSAVKNGASNYLIKPIKFSKLEEVLNKLLS